jgi:hypothetical protein
MPLQASRRAFEDAETGHRAYVVVGVVPRRFEDGRDGARLRGVGRGDTDGAMALVSNDIVAASLGEKGAPKCTTGRIPLSVAGEPG